MSNSFQKKLHTKPSVLIDSCVFMGGLLQKDHNLAHFLSKSGKSYRGFVTHTILGEIVDRSAKKLIRYSDLQLYVEELLSFILHGLKIKKFVTLPIVLNRDSYCINLLNNFHVPLDDTFHLSSCIVSNVKEFATTDKRIIGSASNLRDAFGISILSLS